MILKPSLFVIGVFILSSCQIKPQKALTSEDLVVSDQSTVDSMAFPKTITSTQKAEDIDFLIFALSEAYGDRQHAPENSFGKAIAALKQIPHTETLADFHDQIDEVLFSILDNHMMRLNS